MEDFNRHAVEMLLSANGRLDLIECFFQEGLIYFSRLKNHHSGDNLCDKKELEKIRDYFVSIGINFSLNDSSIEKFLNFMEGKEGYLKNQCVKYIESNKKRLIEKFLE